MSSSLGEKLRQAREERGISVSEVSEQTRISPLYLSAIENDDYKTLPGGIFNKGFVKSYAKYVGFDEQEALQEYSRLVVEKEGRDVDEFKSYRPEVLTDDRSGSIVPTVIFAGIILALMTGGILFLVNYIVNQPSEPSVATNNAPQSSNANTNPSATANLGPAVSAVPSMETLKVEFRASAQEVSVSAVSDGKTSYILVTPDRPATFEPKEHLRLKYSKSLARLAQLTMNGKTISLPAIPANPKRAAIEVEINKDNLAQIWQTGEIHPVGATVSVVEPTLAPVAETGRVTSTPAPATDASPAPVTSRRTPRPGPTSTVRVGTPLPAPTPIVVGRPTTEATPRRSPD